MIHALPMKRAAIGRALSRPANAKCRHHIRATQVGTLASDWIRLKTVDFERRDIVDHLLALHVILAVVANIIDPVIVVAD